MLGKLWTRVASPNKKIFQKDSCPTQKFFGNLFYAGFREEAAKKYQQKEGRRIKDP